MDDEDDKAEGSMRGGSGGAGLERAAFSLLREIVGLAADERELHLAGHDPEVAARVREILDTDGDPTEPLAGGLPFPPAALGVDDGGIRPEADGLGRIGPYRLLAVLGEGGMGRVYLAEQGEPVERRVALKVIGSRFLDDHTRLRFQAERQALARLSHPHIAQLYEAGSTADGSPYFAMELVEGPPITRYCDEAHLDLRQRIELFLSVCDGVAHAHQKGILHRDLKPNNVLVSEVAGHPQAKVIDFGIAKAIDRPLVEATLLTHAMIGTPAYMSPEAVNDGQRVDTRSDVYSLGVLLYELLVGVRPIEESGDHALRVLSRIVDEEPSRPSTRWRQLDEETREAAAGGRGLAAEDVLRALDGDLDWIVMKAIAKDPGRRYGSVRELAADLERMLRDEPVTARPPSTAYLLRKIVARNRGLVTAVVLVVAALLAGTVGTSAGFLRARAEAREALEARNAESEVSEFLTGIFLASSADAPGSDRAPWEVTARDLLERGSRRIESELAGEPLLAARFGSTLGEVYRSLGLFDEARNHLEAAVRAVDRAADSENRAAQALLARIERELAQVSLRQARYDEARRRLERARELGEGAMEGPERLSFEASLLDVSSRVARREGRFDLAEEQRREANRLLASLPEPDEHALLGGLNNLGVLYFEQGRWVEAEAEFRRALELGRRVLPPGHARTAQALENLGAAIANQGRLEEAAPLYAEALETKRARLGEDHPAIGISLNNLGQTHLDLGRPAEAEPFHRQALALRRRTLGPDHPDTAWSLDNLARTLDELGRTQEARELQVEALRVRRGALGEEHPQIARSLEHLGRLARESEEWDTAEGFYREALLVRRAAGKAENAPLARTAAKLGELLALRDRPAEAREVLSEGLAALADRPGDEEDRELRQRLEELLGSV